MEARNSTAGGAHRRSDGVKNALAVRKVKSVFVQLWSDEEGLTTVEYALILALVVIAGAAGWDQLAESLVNTANEPISVLQTADQSQ